MSKIFILGPCAAETREQVLQTAEQLNSQLFNETATLNSKLSTLNFTYRAGIWKPRTSPHSFQGVGEPGLSWLAEVAARYNVPVATEVATPEHVKKIADFCNSKLINESASLNSKLSTLNLYLWIGARTSANPIAVQAIADTLTEYTANHSLPFERKVGIGSVLIKNPVNEDVNLWIGNIERLLKTGLPVMAVHRGCNHKPCWAMAFELRRRMPDIPLLLDPSHMSGEAAQVPALCQLAMDLDYDGLMIEVHNDPAHALSDAKQQLTPAQALNVIQNLNYRSTASTLPIEGRGGDESILLELRQQIDELDDDLWSLIAKRVAIAEQIGQYKREHNLPVLQTKRYDEILKRRLEWAKKNGISADAVQSVLETLHNECVSVQL